MKKLFLSLALVLSCTHASAENFAPQLKGKRLILENAACAGWTFDPSGRFADWRNEEDCAGTAGDYKSRWRVQWLDNNNLVLTETERSDEKMPPRNFVYQVVSINGRTVKLKEFWTGWGEHRPSITTFTIR